MPEADRREPVESDAPDGGVRTEAAAPPCCDGGRRPATGGACALQVVLLAGSLAASAAYFIVRNTDIKQRIMSALKHDSYSPERAAWPLGLSILWTLFFLAIPVLAGVLAARKKQAGTRSECVWWVALAAVLVLLGAFIYATENTYFTYPTGEGEHYYIWHDHFRVREVFLPRTETGHDGRKREAINGDRDEVRNMVVASFMAEQGLAGYVDGWRDVPKSEIMRKYIDWGLKEHPPLYNVLLSMGIRAGGLRSVRWVQFFVAAAFLVALAGALRAHGFSSAAACAVLVFTMPAMVKYTLSKAESDVLVAAFVMFAVWLLAYGKARRGLLWMALAGVMLAAALWTKYTALVSVGALTVFVLLGIRGLPVRRRIAGAALMLAAAFVVVLPLMLWLRGTPTGQASMRGRSRRSSGGRSHE